MNARPAGTPEAGRSNCSWTRCLGAVGCLAIAACLAGPPAAKWLERRFSPDPHGTTTEAAASLRKMWRSPNFFARQTALAYLARELKDNPALFAPLAPEILAATKDGDFEARELAFAILATQRHPALARLAEEQLSDLDPAVRLLGLRYLMDAETPQTVGAVAALLDDQDPQVLNGALAVLGKIAGKGSGAPDAPPAQLSKYSRETSSTPAASEALQRQARDWKIWWAGQQGKYPQPAPSATAPVPGGQPAPDFSLREIGDRTIRLADLKGKMVLLNFFDPQRPCCGEYLQVLAKIQQQMAGELVVLAVCLQTGSAHDCDSPHTPEAEKEHELALAKIRASLQQFAQERGINFPLLMDPHKTVIGPFDGGTPATTILIGRQGQIRRRLFGPRSVEILQSLVNELK